jgi:ACS family hexuronate transporter-like MFS transporter
VLLVSLAAAAHQWWSANLFTTVSDMFPPRAVASVVGIGGCAGAISSTLIQRMIGQSLDATGGSYAPIFLVCGASYVVCWIIIHLLAPRLSPVPEEVLNR